MCLVIPVVFISYEFQSLLDDGVEQIYYAYSS